MKKIVFLASANPDPRIIRKAESLSKEYAVYLIFWNREDEKVDMPFQTGLQQANIYKIQLGNPYGKKFKRLKLTFQFKRQVKQILDQIKPDVIHACGFDMAFISYLYTHRRPVKIVYEVADIHSLMLKGIIINLQKLMIKKIDLLILTSEGFWFNYFEKYGICTEKDKYLIIPNAPEKRIFANYVKKKEVERLTIGYCGLMRFKEQLLMLIEAVEELRKKGYNIDIFLAGNGIDTETVKEYAKNCNFITYIDKYNYRTDIANLYGNLDITFCLYPVNNIKKDVLANRFYDSVVCELPIISPKGSWQGILTECYAVGFTVDVTDKNELRDLLEKLYTQRDIVTQVSKRCQELKSSFEYESFEEILLTKYRQVF